MLDIGQAIATPKDRFRAVAAAAALCVGALLALPVTQIPLGRSYALFAVVIALTIGAIGLTSLLLWAQARVTCSVPLTVLSLGYGMTALVMVPYLIFFHGLWPAASAWASADPATSGWLWLEWHAVFVGSTLAYHVVRQRRIDPPPRATFDRVSRRLALGAAVVVGAIVPPCIWIDGLPPFSLQDGRTEIAFISVGAIVIAAIVSILIGRRSDRYRATLDWWLAVVCVAIVLDVTLWASAQHAFTVGWYVSRIDILVAGGALLVVMLFQTARIYAQVVSTAERLRVESLTDVLTGLSNRRSFDQRLNEVLRDGARSSRPTSLLMIDIDDFKCFNDGYGHQAGDDCLRVVAETLRESAGRSRDLISRIGGEEFAVIMAETDIPGALTVGQRMQQAVEDFALRQGPGSTHGVVTISIGVASLTDIEGALPERLVAEADRALYLAKAAGRNCVIAASVPEGVAAN